MFGGHHSMKTVLEGQNIGKHWVRETVMVTRRAKNWNINILYETARGTWCSGFLSISKLTMGRL